MRKGIPLRHTLVVLALLALPSCKRAAPSVPDHGPAVEPAQSAQAPEQWLIGPEPAADLLRAEASEASLRTQFGGDVVRTDSVYVGEGLSELGTILFPGDSARQLAIVWEDTVGRARPVYVYVTGRKNTWRLYPGVGIGTDLKTLEALVRPR